MREFQAGFFQKNINGYQSFQPEKINRVFHFEGGELMATLEKAQLALGELNAFSELVPDIDHFIRLHVVKEATFSSKIEGTRTQMEDVLLKEEEINAERRDDWREVNNYIAAMNETIEQMPSLPISSRLLRSAHARLLVGARGEHKMPGDFRRSQNWIGGATLADAAFIPPIWQEVDPLMGDLEKFLHNNQTGLPHVLKIALAHYQFETIHPFLDGNGRIGRLLIPLYLIHSGVLRRPVLYLSEYFERHRQVYYDHLMAVRTTHQLSRWFQFVLGGIAETAEKGVSGLRQIVALQKNCQNERLPQLGRKMSVANLLLQQLFLSPILRPDEVAKRTNLSPASAYKLIDDFVKLGILEELTGGQRNRIFIFRAYFDIFK